MMKALLLFPTSAHVTLLNIHCVCGDGTPLLVPMRREAHFHASVRFHLNSITLPNPGRPPPLERWNLKILQRAFGSGAPPPPQRRGTHLARPPCPTAGTSVRLKIDEC
ncbi:hypothetical protein B0H17DRAFT_128279 [Mycena rosella]|uniref:Secreted protein n=1 Tax=Mycena rosella TaxID=1033263 RepID=A0AAD7D436_MYCRO|nr:hypothetical protein B0H17DRAFT_128279 [Mycena rosella]